MALHRNGQIYVTMGSGLDFSFPVQDNAGLEGKLEHPL